MTRDSAHATVGFCYSVDDGSLPINPKYNCLIYINFYISMVLNTIQPKYCFLY